MSGSAFKERKGQKPAPAPSAQVGGKGTGSPGIKIVKDGRANPRAVQTQHDPQYNKPAVIVSYRD